MLKTKKKSSIYQCDGVRPPYGCGEPACGDRYRAVGTSTDTLIHLRIDLKTPEMETKGAIYFYIC
ncbi:hypothetical protein BDZ91DRAFT_725004 [Kalaharituber pfeilii]|nr:hypothetical protein BDZ91DRAFT_725004 [Kalaharituber pfeilii]